MRRADREVRDPAAIDEIIRAAPCCRLGLLDGTEVYIVPLSFGFTHENGRRTFYFHSAKDGRKLALLRQNGRVSFELDCGYELIPGVLACKHSMRFSSVMGTGYVRFLEQAGGKRAALLAIMRQATGCGDWEIPDAALEHVVVFALDVEDLSAKQRN